MRNTSRTPRAAAVEALFAQICRAKPGEARDLAMLLTPSERADMALFCYARTHIREQGRAIASVCAREDLVRAGGQAGAALFDGAGAAGRHLGRRRRVREEGGDAGGITLKSTVNDEAQGVEQRFCNQMFCFMGI